MDISTTTQKSWTILSLIDWSTNHLIEKGFDDARLNVELLLCSVLKCSRIDLYLKFDKILSSKELADFKSLFQRRLTHEPLQYILGETSFMGLRLNVDKRVFIPRPETEVLVERAIRLSRICTDSSNNIRTILDIGTGSGNVAISIAHLLKDVHIDSIDISSDALAVAKLNIPKHSLENRIKLFQHDFLGDKTGFNSRAYDLIISNPPYIPKEEFEKLQPEIKEYEPSIANTDSADGMTFYQAIAQKGKDLLRTNGWVIVEIAYNQSDVVRKIFQSNGYIDIQLFQDYSGNDRVVQTRWKV
ncbi:MAG: peptide chain release factor N(5)-glutamine methyltransferase [Bacteroidota bacterium]|nr:peptide chain release factor N(5)-glutamine methyltransferase [Bacteroidota bacterium]